MGHAEAAAGAAGLVKLLLMLQKNRVPPQISLQTLNPRLPDLAASNMQISRNGESWERSSRTPRRAMLNNFGAAGSNAALIVEENPVRQVAHQLPARSSYVFNITAKRERDVRQYCVAYAQMLLRSQATSLQDVCYTQSARRTLYGYRLPLACHSVEDLAQQLSKAAGRPVSGPQATRPCIFVFSGQGSFYAGMGRTLLQTSPVFRGKVEECDRLMASLGHGSVVAMIEAEQSPHPTSVESILYVQLATFCVEIALAAMWMSWNIKPAAVVGHR